MGGPTNRAVANEIGLTHPCVLCGQGLLIGGRQTHVLTHREATTNGAIVDAFEYSSRDDDDDDDATIAGTSPTTSA